jgi:hypothetical protein
VYPKNAVADDPSADTATQFTRGVGPTFAASAGIANASAQARQPTTATVARRPRRRRRGMFSPVFN